VLRAVVLTQYRRVTVGQTDGIAAASTALAMRRAVKTDVDKLERVQKRATKLIPELSTKSYSDRF